MHRLYLPLFLSAAVLIGGPVLAQTTPRPVAAKDLAKYWLVASEAMEAMKPNTGVNLYAPSCAVVRYVINSDGSTSDVVLEKLVPPGDLGIVATTAIQSLRYAAAPSNQALVPVLTHVTLPMNLPPPRGTPEEQAKIQAQRDEVLARCDTTAAVAPAKDSGAHDSAAKQSAVKDAAAKPAPAKPAPVRQR